MNNELVKYSMDNNLNDLNGTINDIGQLISSMRDLTRSLVPLSDNLNDIIEDFPDNINKFLVSNQPLLFAGIAGIILLGGFLGTGIIKNIITIKNEIK